jgi:hypothetical protein
MRSSLGAYHIAPDDDCTQAIEHYGYAPTDFVQDLADGMRCLVRRTPAECLHPTTSGL